MRATAFALLAAALASSASACLKYSHTLQESFVGTNTWYYQLVDEGDVKCEANQPSTGFGKSQFHADCESGWSIDMDTDEGTWGTVHLHKPNGQNFDLPLEQNGPDHQFGCGNTVCVGVEELRTAQAFC